LQNISFTIYRSGSYTMNESYFLFHMYGCSLKLVHSICLTGKCNRFSTTPSALIWTFKIL